MAIQGYAFNFLSTFKDYPPSQTAGDWSLSKVEKKISEMTTKSN
jgi:arylsulfatase